MMELQELISSCGGYRNAEGILRVVREGLCHRCGACVGVCPDNTFALRDGYPVVVGDCSQCNLCVEVCSGLEVDYPRLGREVYGERGYEFGSLTGPVRSVWVAHAADAAVRELGGSGGVITAMLLHWIRTRRIRGAIVTVDDPVEPARAAGLIARTEADVLRGARSRYTTAPTLAVLREIRDEPGPFVLVGLPCHVHALRMLQIREPQWRERISFVVGLFCHYALPWESVRLVGETFAPRGARLVSVGYRDKHSAQWPNNSARFTYDDGSEWRSPLTAPATFNVLSRLVPLGRCLMCADACSEFSDVAVGDPWIRGSDGRWKFRDPRGDSMVIVHTAQGEEWWQKLVDERVVVAVPVALDEATQRGHDSMLREKKERVGFRLRWRRRLGLPVPRYPGIQFPRPTRISLKEEFGFLLTRLLAWSSCWQRIALRVAFSRWGVAWVNWRRRRRRARPTPVPLNPNRP